LALSPRQPDVPAFPYRRGQGSSPCVGRAGSSGGGTVEQVRSWRVGPGRGLVAPDPGDSKPRAVGSEDAQEDRAANRTALGFAALASGRAGFARRQVVTARNIRGGRFTTFMLGGLNYQIEHHLFPSMPRPNLRRVQGLVRDFCALPASCWPPCPDSRSGPNPPLPVSHPGRQQRTSPANRCGLTVSLTGAALLVSSSRASLGFTSAEVVYGVTGTDVTALPEYGVAVRRGGHLAILRNGEPGRRRAKWRPR
jgi:hypothetical protein